MVERVFSVTAKALRVRQQPSTSAAILGLLQRGQLVARLDIVDRAGWWRIFADTPGDGAQIGYVASRYLAHWSADQVDASIDATPLPPIPPAAPPPSASVSPPAPEPEPEPPREPEPEREVEPAPAASPRLALALTEEGFQRQVDRLGVGLAELWAVLKVEARGEGFFVEQEVRRLPQILFERHIFSTQTAHGFDASHPEISSPHRYSLKDSAPPPDRYGGHAQQYRRLAQAVSLDRRAALMSASWGLGQVMGFNYEVAGYPSVEAMVADMRRAEDAQLSAMVGFVLAHDLAGALQAHRWADFARVYNGASYADNGYDRKLAEAYAALAAGAPDIMLRRVQLYLRFLGFYASPPDGLWGGKSRGAVVDYLASKGDAVDEAKLMDTPPRAFLEAVAESAEADTMSPEPAWPLDEPWRGPVA